MRIFATLVAADSGRALVGGHDVLAEAAVVRAMIGLAGQYAAVDPFLTGRENLELVGEPGRVIAAGSPSQLKANVGGDHLELTVPDPRQRQAARAVLGSRAEPPGAREPQIIRIPLPAGGEVPVSLVAELAGCGVRVRAPAVAQRRTISSAVTGTSPGRPGGQGNRVR